MSPMTPHLMIAPLSTAEPAAGAAGCAIGNQKCTGTRPIFMVKPAMRHPIVASRQGDVGSAATASVMTRLPPGLFIANNTKPISKQEMLELLAEIDCVRFRISEIDRVSKIENLLDARAGGRHGARCVGLGAGFAPGRSHDRGLCVDL